jgi:hypothetical protein
MRLLGVEKVEDLGLQHVCAAPIKPSSRFHCLWCTPLLTDR